MTDTKRNDSKLKRIPPLNSSWKFVSQIGILQTPWEKKAQMNQIQQNYFILQKNKITIDSNRRD